MKSKDVTLILACAWIGTAIAVIVGLYVTHSPWCLLALCSPACMSTKTTNVTNGYDIVDAK